MDIAKALVKCVARAFYDTRHILVLDALMIHNAYLSLPPLVVGCTDWNRVRDDELARLLGLVTKDVHKLCGKLKEDRMLSVLASRPLLPSSADPADTHGQNKKTGSSAL
jgi:transcription initiation factor TFIIE subunit alpha